MNNQIKYQNYPPPPGPEAAPMPEVISRLESLMDALSHRGELIDCLTARLAPVLGPVSVGAGRPAPLAEVDCCALGGDLRQVIEAVWEQNSVLSSLLERLQL